MCRVYIYNIVYIYIDRTKCNRVRCKCLVRYGRLDGKYTLDNQRESSFWGYAIFGF